MIPVRLPTFETEATHELCLEIAKKSKGVCLLSFSRGKDSLCAWLQLKKYFTRIIPVHCASYPLLKSTKRVLDFYEEALCDKAKGERIIRLVGEELPMSLPRMMYQTMDEIDDLLALETPDFSKLDVYEMLRKELSLPRAWCGVGISVGDSIDRRIYCKKVEGRNPNNLTFYPCWDWERKDILNAVRESGLKLTDEYRYVSRTLGSMPGYTILKVYREHYPEDYERILSCWPLAEAKTYRENMLDVEWKRRKELGIVDDEDVSPEGSGEFDDGTDVMPELGMGGSDIDRDV